MPPISLLSHQLNDTGYLIGVDHFRKIKCRANGSV